MCSRAKPWSDGAPVAPSGPPLQRWHCETGLDVGGDYKKNRLTGRDRGEKVRVSSPLNPAPAPLSSQIACSSLVNSAAQPSSVRIEGKPLVLCKRHGGNSLLLYAPSTPRDSRDFFPSTVLLLIRGSLPLPPLCAAPKPPACPPQPDSPTTSSPFRPVRRSSQTRLGFPPTSFQTERARRQHR
jgi:hypothetical protein